MTPEPAVTSGPAGSGVFAPRSDGRPVIRWLFTTRDGGVSRPPYDGLNLGGSVGDDQSAVAINRARAAAAAGLAPNDVVWMRQVHGSAVVHVETRPTGGGAPVLADCDGTVTAEPGLALAVLVADCVPILAGDPVAGVIAAVHAGRRGAAGGITAAMLERMTELGAECSDITVVLGPAICGACYEVPSAMRDEVAQVLPGSASTTDRGTPGLDLRAGLAAQLRAAGVAEVVVDPRCTYTEPSLYSHRRDAPTGRFAGLIWMPR